jgi:hypothetical protein
MRLIEHGLLSPNVGLCLNYALHGPSRLSICRSATSGDWRPLLLRTADFATSRSGSRRIVLGVRCFRLLRIFCFMTAFLVPTLSADTGYNRRIRGLVLLGTAVVVHQDRGCPVPNASGSSQTCPSTINLRLGAVRCLAYEAADCGLLSTDLAARIRRVKGVKKLGVRIGNWLTADQTQALWQAPDRVRLKGKRDQTLVAVLLACGLRRHELAGLTVDHLQQREGDWAIIDMRGKVGPFGPSRSPIGCGVSWATG